MLRGMSIGHRDLARFVENKVNRVDKLVQTQWGSLSNGLLHSVSGCFLTTIIVREI